jgi:hypothetical protein
MLVYSMPACAPAFYRRSVLEVRAGGGEVIGGEATDGETTDGEAIGSAAWLRAASASFAS